MISTSHPNPEGAAPHEEGFASQLDRALRVLGIATEITALGNPEDVSRHVVRCLTRELHFQAVSVLLQNPATGKLQYAADSGVPEEVKAMGFREQGITLGVFRTGEAIFVEDMAHDGSANPAARPYFKSYAALPIQHRDRAFGVILVNYSNAHVFDPMERQILRTFASQMAVALDNTRLLAATQQKADTLSALARLGHALTERMDLGHILEVLEHGLRDHLPQVETGVLWLIEGRSHLKPSFHYGLGNLAGELPPIDMPGSLLACTTPQILPLLPMLGRDFQPGDAAWGDALALVLRTPSGAEGLLMLHSTGGPGMLRAQDIDFLRALADLASLAIHHARLFESTRNAACRDSLTGLLNHGAFTSAAEERIARTLQEGRPLSILMLDADHFKVCNDTHGHPFGDRVLVALAKTLKAQVRPTDLAGRWGGEEFVILLPDAGMEMAFGVAERIRRAMGSMLLPAPGGRKVPAPTVSIGIASLEAGGQGFAELLQAADSALYDAKRAGRNQTLRFDPTRPTPEESMP